MAAVTLTLTQSVTTLALSQQTVSLTLNNGPSTWGSIGGTLANQADLTTALNAKFPMSGGTLTGALTLAADPAAALQPATKQYTDAADALRIQAANNLADLQNAATARANLAVVATADLANSSDPTKGDALVGVRQTQSGAVARTVHAKLGEYLSAADFGAVGDGVTDDTAALQAAINAAATANVPLRLPALTYLVSYSGQITTDVLSTPYCLLVNQTLGPLHLDCAPGATLKLAAAQRASTVMLLVAGTSAAYRTSPTLITGATFDGNAANQSGFTDFATLTVIYSLDVRVARCRFQAWPEFAVHVLRDSQGFRLDECVFDSTAAASTALRLESNGAVISRSRFVTDALAGHPHLSVGCNADILMQPRGMRIVNNEFHGNGPVYLDGVTHCVVEGNLFRDVCNLSGWALIVDHYTNVNGTYFSSSDNVIQGNAFFNVRQGIHLVGNTAPLAWTNGGGSGTTTYNAGAFRNLVANNTFTRDLELIQTQFGTGTSYPVRFALAPNAATVNLATGISEGVTPSVTGTATAGAATTLTDGGKTWTTNQWANYSLYITGGTGAGQVRTIGSNTATVLTVSSGWTTTPNTTSTYAIGNVTGDNHIRGNYIDASSASTKGIQILGPSAQTEVIENTITGTSTANAITPNFALCRRNNGYSTETRGVASVANTGTIPHGLAATPTKYGATGTTAGHIATVTAVSATTLTIGLTNFDGTAVAVAENVAWWAEV